MNGDYSERISQESERYQNSESSILDAASEVARRVLEEIEALAGTTSCKSVQLVRLRKWAEERVHPYFRIFCVFTHDFRLQR